MGRRFGIPRNDVAGATAVLIAGSWMAYRNSRFPDEQFKTLVGQMRRVIGSGADFARTQPDARQEMFDQMVITGMFMATVQMALERQPDDAVAVRMHDAGRQQLEAFLHADADAVTLDAQGLSIR